MPHVFGGRVIVLLFGAPGSGKGTQASLISKLRRIPSISTGDMLRAECRRQSDLGTAAQAVLANGSLVDDHVVNAMVVQRITQRDCDQGFILDGYPRTLAQANFLSDFLQEVGLTELKIIHLDVPTPVLVSRLSSRRQCPACGHIYNLLRCRPVTENRCDRDGETLVQREDDRETVVRQRLNAYRTLSAPVIKYYKGPNYYRIDGQSAPEKISEKIQAIINAPHPHIKSTVRPRAAALYPAIE